MVVLAPDPHWVRTLPNAKLPDRNDFRALRHRPARAREGLERGGGGQRSSWRMSLRRVEAL
jgi:hypothetical protein